jgi:hypothetical protein
MIGQNAGENFAKMTPRNNVYWSYFRINRVKTLFGGLLDIPTGQQTYKSKTKAHRHLSNFNA